MKTKCCSICKVKKELYEFGPDHRSSDAHKSECQSCLRKYFRARRRRLNPEWFNRTDKSRFWKLVDKQKTCWIWQGTRAIEYGRFYMQHKRYPAHQASWIINKGQIPKGIFVLHRCDNPLCVRPSHLFLGTHQDNMLDMKLKRRRNRPKRIVNQEMAYQIRQYAAKGESKIKIAKRYGLSWRHVYAIVRGDYWQ